MADGGYVNRGGEQVYSPPFEARGVDFYAFLLPADAAAMQASICDRCLNGPMGRPGVFRIAIPYVMLVFNNIGQLVSTQPPFDMRGVFPEQEMAFWTLILDRERERLFWFQPYILVDNAYALSMGREIYGFPKELGWFDIPEDHKSIDRLSTETIVVPKFGPDAETGRRLLVEVVRHGERSPAITVIDSLEILVRTAYRTLSETPGLAADVRLAEHELAALLNLEIDMVFLKQFRDARHPAHACYQGIVETDCECRNVSGIVLYEDRFEVHIPDYDSHPIRADLGLPPGPLESLVSFWTGFDFLIGDGKVVWSTDR